MKFINKCKKGLDCSVFILFLSAGLFVWTTVSASDEPSYIHDYISSDWVVSEGESLWSIAKVAHENTELSIEQTLNWMKSKNNLDSEAIYPGQKIAVPSYIGDFAGE
ncbi:MULTISPECIES: cell division suppressor protein YneA [Bacillaceae]|uniref:LysM peptidoglycan-binding domain-containing protein n=1 Tax=Evansella alkalicola TaxID=745819 RepID=A0ABS6JVM2_9BACI|nr:MULTISPECIES: LysM peptidoglycan-binding domain-containing protein [Bacillaceae]MBU9722649.1 LysM peptidoglycan-binding domain-containing protein [Bacillus alkalicola]